MRQASTNFRAAAITFTVLLISACGSCSSKPAPPAPIDQVELPPAVQLAPAANSDTTEGIIRYLEERVKKDPEDFIAYNKLNGYYLQRARESGDVKYFELAERAARASLKVVADEMNTGGLAG
ncbi:MAG: hypothetical protein ND895_15620, partial [Pyrinomonadaceae bacterium]|nr:hypothetical protein [Pyrinomonadaceae bacterium]